MTGVNKVILIGNLGKDPEIKHLENGTKLATFSVATTENYRDRSSNEKKEQTEWHHIIGWRAIADSVEKSELKKGDRVYLEGKIRYRKYTPKDTNVERQVTEIVCDQFVIIGRKRVSEAIDNHE